MNTTENSNSSTEQMEIVAVDDGYAVTKVVFGNGVQLKYPSLMTLGLVGMEESSTDLPGYWTTSGTNEAEEQVIFSACKASNINAVDTRFDEYPYSGLNRSMIHHALRSAGLAGKNIRLGTSLPVRTYYDSKGVNKQNIARKRNSLLIPVRAASGLPCALIGKSEVYAEGVSAWIDFAVADGGEERVVLDQPAAVVDIGGRTTDTVKILAGLTVERVASGTINKGVLDFLMAVRQQISRLDPVQELFGGQINIHEIPRSVVEKTIQSGFYEGHGIRFDMNEILGIERKKIAQEILQDVERRIAKGFDLEQLVFVGGGSIVFQEEIKKYFPTASFVEDPEYSNARGMYKYMRWIA